MQADHELPPAPTPVIGGMTGGNDSYTGGGKMVRSDDGGRGKTRFTDEQVRSMECTFEAQTTLEPRRKAQLAERLGLQPRQVAVWFQNRRARWKSKQLEREYGALQAEYDALRSSFEALEREKQSLAAQLRRLAGILLLEMEEESGNNNGNSSGDGNSEGKEERGPSGGLVMEGHVEGKQMGLAAEGGTLIGSTEGRQQLEASRCASEPITWGPAGRECCFYAGDSLSDVQSGGSSTDWWDLWVPN